MRKRHEECEDTICWKIREPRRCVFCENPEKCFGQELCEHFGISRTAVWKMMNQLKEEGYEIEAVQNKGYRLLNEPDLVTKDELESRTHTKYVGQTVYYSREVDSTNTWAKRRKRVRRTVH